VLGLVGRDLVLDALEAVAAEDASAAFAIVERALERGYDLRLLCRELARATRDLLILSVDPSRAEDADVAAEGERDRLKSLASRSSREDLLRAFDVLTKAEQEVKASDQPRYSVEMALLRLIHMRKLTPLADLIARAESGGSVPLRAASAPVRTASTITRGADAPAAPAKPSALREPSEPREPTEPTVPTAPGGALKDAFLNQVKSSKVFLYNTVIAQAYRIDVTPSRITFAFLPNQRVPKQQCEEARGALETIAEKVAGQKIPVSVVVAEAAPANTPSPAVKTPVATASAKPSEDELRREALSDPGVQALFEIFPVEKSKVEEM
jgi:DNA polymerase III gamma/tau subunit